MPRSSSAPSRRPSRPASRSAGSARLFGAHHSIAGGMPKAVERAVETGCNCLQVFTRNINQWAVKPLDPAVAAAFRDAVAEAGLKLVVAHDSYLINPASADDDLREKSIAGLVTELERADMLGIPWVVAHPGAAGEQERAVAVRRVADGIAEALKRTKTLSSGILIETTAGQGSCLGDTFAEIAAMLKRIDRAKTLQPRVAICLDTCHVFAAGYPLSPRSALDETLQEFDQTIGLKRLKLIHANDSKREQGSHVDRHEAIGKGHIGQAAFKLLVTHPKLKKVPFILETPKEGADGKPDPANDIRNLQLLRRMAT